MKKYDSVFSKLSILNITLTIAVALIIATTSTLIAEKLLLRQVTNSSSTNMDYIKSSLLDYNTEVVSTMSKVTFSPAFKKFLTVTYSNATEHFGIVTDLGQYLDTIKDDLTPKGSYIRVSGNNSMYYTSNSLKWDKEMDNVLENYMTLNGHIPNRILYHNNTFAFDDSFPYENSIFATKPLVDNTTQGMYGYILVIIDEAILEQMYKQYVGPGTTISIISPSGSIWSSSDRKKVNSTDRELLTYAQNIMAQDLDSINVTRNEKEHTILAQHLPFYDAYIIQEIDKSIAFSDLYQLKYYIFLILLVALCITIITVYFISRKITKPLTHVVDVMSNLTGENLHKEQIIVTGSHETRMLATTYNNMLEVMDSHMKKLVLEQEERRKAELTALQMQIHPHFLYNTLSSIKYLAKENKIDEVEKTINSLISILQSTIGTSDELISLEKEIANLHDYVYINQIRYGEQVTVNFNIPKELLAINIPKLTIQPFVENAFFHAFPDTQSGNINIFARDKDGDLMIEIIDNGTGISQDNLDTLTSSKHHATGIGVRNVDERLKLLYGNKYGINIQSDLGFGTSIIITIPKH